MVNFHILVIYTCKKFWYCFIFYEILSLSFWLKSSLMLHFLAKHWPSRFCVNEYIAKFIRKSFVTFFSGRCDVHLQISTLPLRVLKWTFTFEMWFIPSWTNWFKPHPHTRHLSGLTSSPSNNVACLLTFAWRRTRIAMTLSAEIWRFGYSKPYVMSDLIQNIWKTSQVRWKSKIDTWLII